MVSFSATFSTAFPVETVSVSFLWDTDTQTFSNIVVNSTGPITILPEIDFALFASPGNPQNYPAGSILSLLFPDATHTGFFTLETLPSEHVPPIPGIYPMDSFISPGGPTAPIPSMGELVTVTEAPEPGSLYLLGFGAFAMLSVLARKKLSRHPITS